jgi:conjugal transfer ATP-binding protein TraC
MADTKTKTIPQSSGQNPATQTPAASQKTAAEIEAASNQKNSQKGTQAVFKPLPEEKAQGTAAKTAAKPIPKAPPKVANPLPQNSVAVATAIGLTSAQIEKQSSQDTIPAKLAAKPSSRVQTIIQKPTPKPKSLVEKVKQTASLEKRSIQKSAPLSHAEKHAAIATLSAKNTGASHKTLLQAPAPAAPAKQNVNPQKVAQDKTAGQQFVNHNQVATGAFIRKLFGKPAKTTTENSATEVLPPEKKTLQQQLAEAEKIYQQGLASVRDLISPSSFEIHYDHLSLSGVLARSFFVYAYPRFLETNWMSPIINFDATVDVSQFIYPIASDEIMGILKKKVAQIQSSITMAQEKGNVRDPQLETALEDAEQLRTDLQRGQEKFFQFGMYFTVYAEDLKKLEATTKIIENQLGGKLVLTKRADIQGEHAFNSTLPLCIDEIEVHRNMNTSPLSTTFPFISSSLATDEGILYGLNRHNNSLIIFDRFKLPNANSCVFASSGAGKSYAVKLEILRQSMLGTDVIIIDPENEYKALTETVGGTYLNMSLNSEQRINPFDLPAPFEGESLKPGDLLRENIINITGLMKLMLGQMTAAEEALIDKALIDTYAVRGITMELEDPSKMPMPTMEDFHSVLSSMKGAEDLAQRLQKFTSGTFGGIFNKETNVDMGSGLIVFCIRDLEEELRPAAMFILLNYIWNRVRSELKKRLLVVDEAWVMMQHEDAAKFLFGLVKRARKYYLGVTTITQDVEDFLGSKYGRPIVTNASMQILLKQAPSSMDILQKTFNLTEGEKYMLLNSGVGQGLFFADSKHVAVQVIASYSENQIVTTNPEELLNQRADGFGEAPKKDA